MYHHDIEYYCQEPLLPKGDEVNTLKHGMAALHETANQGDIATCKTLLDRGALVELKSSPETRGMTALHFAAEGGHSSVIQLLLARGADPHSRSRSQATPFYRAARSGSLEALGILYAAGSDINAQTWDHWTPLYEAVAGGQVHTANQLLEWRADPTITTAPGDNVLAVISEAMEDDHHRNETYDDMRTDLDPEAESPSGARDGGEEREAMILREIQMLQATTRANSSNERFHKFLDNLAPGYSRPQRIDFDTRPGRERDKSHIFIEGGGIDGGSNVYMIA